LWALFASLTISFVPSYLRYILWRPWLVRMCVLCAQFGTLLFSRPHIFINKIFLPSCQIAAGLRQYSSPQFPVPQGSVPYCPVWRLPNSLNRRCTVQATDKLIMNSEFGNCCYVTWSCDSLLNATEKPFVCHFIQEIQEAFCDPTDFRHLLSVSNKSQPLGEVW
jgi:hypothetical protein